MMESQYGAVQLSTTSPNFLNSNSTSHEWAFGAIAELIDNAVDPDVGASQFIIDYYDFGDAAEPIPGIICMDNGIGLNPHKLHLMLGFGHSDKHIFQGRAIGQYGNGFKSGTMRLGTDVLVFTCDRESKIFSVGFLSQTFLKVCAKFLLSGPVSQVRAWGGHHEMKVRAEIQAIGAKTIRVPIVSWRLVPRHDGSAEQCMERVKVTMQTAEDGSTVLECGPKDEASDQSLEAIYRYSCFTEEDAILQQLQELKNSGTIIIITGLRKAGGKLELDFETDPHDIQIRADDFSDEFHGARRTNFRLGHSADSAAMEVPLQYSLRAYVQILYKVPRMQIFIRSNHIRTQRITSWLRYRSTEKYTPKLSSGRPLSEPSAASASAADIEVGFNVNDLKLYGVMLYHRGRLIEHFKRIGIQLDANSNGVGVLCIVDCDFLTPTHNKQTFDNNQLYRRLMVKLAEVIKVYWHERVVSSGPPPELADRLKIAFGDLKANTDALQQGRAPQPRRGAAPVPVPEGADLLWAQCSRTECRRWRLLPPGTDMHEIEAMPLWHCEMHPDPAKARAGCAAPEDAMPHASARLQDARRSFKQHEAAQRQRKRQRDEPQPLETRRILEENFKLKQELETMQRGQMHPLPGHLYGSASQQPTGPTPSQQSPQQVSLQSSQQRTQLHAQEVHRLQQLNAQAARATLAAHQSPRGPPSASRVQQPALAAVPPTNHSVISPPGTFYSSAGQSPAYDAAAHDMARPAGVQPRPPAGSAIAANASSQQAPLAASATPSTNHAQPGPQRVSDGVIDLVDEDDNDSVALMGCSAGGSKLGVKAEAEMAKPLLRQADNVAACDSGPAAPASPSPALLCQAASAAQDVQHPILPQGAAMQCRAEQQVSFDHGSAGQGPGAADLNSCGGADETLGHEYDSAADSVPTANGAESPGQAESDATDVATEPMCAEPVSGEAPIGTETVEAPENDGGAVVDGPKAANGLPGANWRGVNGLHICNLPGATRPGTNGSSDVGVAGSAEGTGGWVWRVRMLMMVMAGQSHQHDLVARVRDCSAAELAALDLQDFCSEVYPTSHGGEFFAQARRQLN